MLRSSIGISGEIIVWGKHISYANLFLYGNKMKEIVDLSDNMTHAVNQTGVQRDDVVVFLIQFDK